MTHQQILEKAIQKAIEGGWEPTDKLSIWVYKTGFVKEEQYGYIYKMVGLNDLIFNHDFAKALWGEDTLPTGDYYKAGNGKVMSGGRPAWQYHLQQMVIAADPIEYLGNNI